jgi:hypothetical protein
MQAEETVQVLAKLLETLIEKLKGQQQSAPVQLPTKEVARVVRTPNMTYQAYLSKVLKERAHIPLPSVASKKASYRLYEDLEIFLEMSSCKNISSQVFEDIASKGKVNRTAESIKARFHDYLIKVTEKDMKKIVEWVEKEGIEGYLVFDKNEVRVSKTDPKESNRELSAAKRPREETLDNEGKAMEKQVKRVVPPQCTELNNILSIYSKMMGVSVKFLLEKLDEVSGDLLALDKYVETRDNRLLWSDDDDKILVKGGVELQVLKKYRGEKEIEKRREYLGL